MSAPAAEFQADLIEAIQHGVMLLDSDLKVVGWNVWLAERLGILRKDALGKSLNELFPGRNFKRLRRKVRSVALLGNYAFFDARVDAPLLPIPNAKASMSEGTEMPQSVVIAQLKGTSTVVITISDHSHIVALDVIVSRTQLELKRSNAALSAFCSVISHDLKAPLRQIRLLSQFLQEDVELPPDATEYTEQIARTTQRLETMVHALLDYSLISATPPAFEQVDLALVARNLAEDLNTWIEERQGILDIGELPTLDADPTQMRQLLQNLIGNAVKYSREGVPPRVSLTATVEPSHIVVKVADNGRGFEPERADQMLKPYERLDNYGEEEGHGLGLAIVAQIVSRHGGTIDIKSVKGSGTTFSVRLPREHDETT